MLYEIILLKEFRKFQIRMQFAILLGWVINVWQRKLSILSSYSFYNGTLTHFRKFTPSLFSLNFSTVFYFSQTDFLLFFVYLMVSQFSVTIPIYNLTNQHSIPSVTKLLDENRGKGIILSITIKTQIKISCQEFTILSAFFLLKNNTPTSKSEKHRSTT